MLSKSGDNDDDEIEGRRALRMRTFIGGRAVFHDGRSTFDCQIRNMSSTGAKLSLKSTVGLPGQFNLEIPDKGVILPAEVRWRTDTTVGVEFVNAEADLQRQNEDLRQQIRHLEKKLLALGGKLT